MILNSGRMYAGALAVDCVTVVDQLPQTHAAVADGLLDWPRARVLAEMLGERGASIIAEVESELVPEAAGLSLRLLRARVHKALIRIDAMAAQERFARAGRGRTSRKWMVCRSPRSSASRCWTSSASVLRELGSRHLLAAASTSSSASRRLAPSVQPARCRVFVGRLAAVASVHPARSNMSRPTFRIGSCGDATGPAGFPLVPELRLLATLTTAIRGPLGPRHAPICAVSAGAITGSKRTRPGGGSSSWTTRPSSSPHPAESPERPDHQVCADLRPSRSCVVDRFGLRSLKTSHRSEFSSCRNAAGRNLAGLHPSA